MPFSATVSVFFVLLFWVASHGVPSAEGTFLRKAFPKADSIGEIRIRAGNSLQNQIKAAAGSRLDYDSIVVFSVFARDSLIGYGLANSVKSKSSTVPLLLLIDASGVIAGLELLNTPDPNGARLQSAGWKKQFIGRSHKNLGRIDAVSGATISSNDITKGVKRLLAYARISGLITKKQFRPSLIDEGSSEK